MIIKTFPDECFFLASILVEIQKSVSQKTLFLKLKTLHARCKIVILSFQDFGNVVIFSLMNQSLSANSTMTFWPRLESKGKTFSVPKLPSSL